MQAPTVTGMRLVVLATSRPPGLLRRVHRVGAVPLVLTGLLIAMSAATPAVASAGAARAARTPSSFTIGGELNGVAAFRGGAWAVGSTGSFKTIILRWDGTSWRRLPSPSAAGGGTCSACTRPLPGMLGRLVQRASLAPK